MGILKKNWFYFAGVILVLVSLFFDRIIVNFVQLGRNSFFDVFLGGVTNFGSLVVILFIVSVLFLWEEKKREWIPAIWVSFIATALIVVVLKFLIMRERPFDVMFIPLTNFVSYSFPSLHTAAAFTALPVLNKEFPKIKWFWILFAVLVGFSRIYLGAHFLSDIIFGAMVGYGAGSVIVYLEDKKKVFKKWIWK